MTVGDPEGALNNPDPKIPQEEESVSGSTSQIPESKIYNPSYYNLKDLLRTGGKFTHIVFKDDVFNKTFELKDRDRPKAVEDLMKKSITEFFEAWQQLAQEIPENKAGQGNLKATISEMVEKYSFRLGSEPNSDSETKS